MILLLFVLSAQTTDGTIQQSMKNPIEAASFTEWSVLCLPGLCILPVSATQPALRLYKRMEGQSSTVTSIGRTSARTNRAILLNAEVGNGTSVKRAGTIR